MNKIFKKSNFKKNIQVHFPYLKYRNHKQSDFLTKSVLGQIVNGKAVLLYTELIIDEMMEIYPTLPLHKSQNNQMLGIGGFIVSRSMDSRLKRLVKEKLSFSIKRSDYCIINLVLRITIFYESRLDYRPKLVTKLYTKIIDGEHIDDSKGSEEDNDHVIHGLNIDDISLIFHMMIFGLLSSLAVLFIENMITKYSNSISNPRFIINPK